MKLILDKYAYLKSPIHAWNHTLKLVALLSLIFAFAFVQKLILLPPMILITVIFYKLSNLPFSFLINRLRYPGLFIVFVVILLPFISGENIIFSLGFISVKKEGFFAVLLITTRFFSILTISIILFGTAPFLTTIKAMRSLGLSEIIVDIMLLTYRYLEELGDTLITMQIALKLRGFKPHKFSKRNLQIIANLIGSLLVRSYDKSKLIYQAMILRGYGYKNKKQKSATLLHFKDWLAFTFTMIIALMFIIIEIIV